MSTKIKKKNRNEEISARYLQRSQTKMVLYSGCLIDKGTRLFLVIFLEIKIASEIL